nr:alpha/beta hydrolase [Candidatus Sigynarchaeota archaeon]
MPKWPEEFIDTNGVHLCYHRTSGDKPAMIMLHGATDNGLCWTSITRDLQDEYDIIMLDARGHGKSIVMSMKSDFSIADMAEDTAALAKQLGLDHPILFGHSMGGLVATLVASKYPDLPSKLILEDPAYFLSKGLKLLVPLLRRLFLRSVRNMGKKSAEEARAECKKQNPNWSDEDVDGIVQAHQQFVRNTSLERIKHFDVFADWNSLFPKIICPVLLLIPSNGFLKLNVAKKVLPSFKNARIAYIPGAGHGVHRDQYAKCMEAIKNFLA